jgi:hypothetical protein
MHRKQIRRWHKLLSASAALLAFLTGAVMAPASAVGAPSVDMFWADVSRTNQPVATFYLMTNVSVKNIEAADFSVLGSATGCTIEDNFSQSSFHVVNVSNCSDGTLAVQLGANSISDLGMNWGPAQGAVSDFMTIDRAAPSFAFDTTLTSVSDTSFNLVAEVSEQASLVDVLMKPTVNGEGCVLAGVSISGPSYSFAITGCKPGADVQVTIYEKSYKDSIGNLGPAQNVVSQLVKVQSLTAPAPLATPTSTPTPTPTANPTPTSTPTPTAEPTLAATLPIEPPAPPTPPVLEPTIELEPIVPFVPIRLAESLASVFEASTPVRLATPVAAAATEPEPVIAQVSPIERSIQVAQSDAQPTAPREAAPNLSWVAPAASVVATMLAAIGVAIFLRKRMPRVARARLA